MVYGKEECPGVPMDQRRKPAKQVSADNTRRPLFTGPANGKFGGLPGGPSGGNMNTGGKRRPGHNAHQGID